MEDVNVSELTDEQLDAHIAGEVPETSENAEPQEDVASVESTEETAEAPEESTTVESDELDWLPEQFRKTFKENPDVATRNIAKSYSELQKKFGRTSKYNDLLSLFESDPSYYEKAVNALTVQEQKEQAQESQTQQVERISDRLKAAEYDDDIVNAFKAMEDKVANQEAMIAKQFEEREKQRVYQKALDSNKQAFSQFMEETQMSSDDFISFINKAQTRINPSGEYGNYTVQDLKAAQIAIDPKGFEENLRSQLMMDLAKQMKQTPTEITPSGSNVQQDPATQRKTENVTPQELNDEELDKALSDAGVVSPYRGFLSKWK